ncbi:hypothetical protein [Streptomyces scabiei]|uniref:hypothetical protein n=1 Tax=Streptomyces scabiei TaxID=1930 RepID=UPI0004E79261|nr:hypothetical protein [Streptomyces scabiei]MBP5926951.1 hypothetical protein [Streptomyces sp. LBUM 1479]KFG06593.1 hypothetical protein IQ61_24025 [Streptomyces scabiei]MDX2536511.1 hypothetical protein [Streptomyces scabiei]MDX2799081.1 hypothetical protein [Streptomyces scabiei]MDX2833256.1 hypothetical protein [Streptomyces scabiei]
MYERTGVPQSAQIRRSPSATVSQVATLRQISRSFRALHVVMPNIVPHDRGTAGAILTVTEAHRADQAHRATDGHRDGGIADGSVKAVPPVQQSR